MRIIVNDISTPQCASKIDVWKNRSNKRKNKLLKDKIKSKKYSKQNKHKTLSLVHLIILF